MISYEFYDLSVSFSKASELSAALLSAITPERIQQANGEPRIVYIDGRDWADAPAWLWVQNLVETRTDWWPSLGIALQHAVRENEKFGRIALEEMLEKVWGAPLGILEWLKPLAKGHDDKLTKRIEKLEVEQDQAEENGIYVGVSDKYDGPSIQVRSEAEVEPALRRSAPFGWTYDLYGLVRPEPWRWLQSGAYGQPWLRPVIPQACANIAHRPDFSERELWSLLDFFATEHDLWRHRALLEQWDANHPSWWKNAAEVPGPHGIHKPWPYPTLGQVASRAREIAKQQAETPPVLDLAPLF